MNNNYFLPIITESHIEQMITSMSNDPLRYIQKCEEQMETENEFLCTALNQTFAKVCENEWQSATIIQTTYDLLRRSANSPLPKVDTVTLALTYNYVGKNPLRSCDKSFTQAHIERIQTHNPALLYITTKLAEQDTDEQEKALLKYSTLLTHCALDLQSQRDSKPGLISPDDLLKIIRE